MKKRAVDIDILRIIGLAMVILAHVYPPTLLFAIRNFDVPLMVFSSGMSYAVAGKNVVDYPRYVIDRAKRLILPVWCFLSLFYLFIYFSGIEAFKDLFHIKTMVSSYMFYGFGYVWIIRVFLVIAIVSPLLFSLVMNKSLKKSLIIILLSLLANEIIFYATMNIHMSPARHLLDDLVFPILGFGAMFCFGLKATQMGQKQLIQLGILSLLVYVILMAYFYLSRGEIVSTQWFKYPPRLYYLAYALSVTLLILTIVRSILNKRNEKIVRTELPGLLTFIASNTIWIYLWHIPFVEFFHRANVEINFGIKYVIALVVPIIVVMIQVKMVNVISERVNLPSLSKNIKIMFTG